MSQPLSFFSYRKGTLSADGVSLPEIAQAVGTPLYIYNAEGFTSSLQKFRRGLKNLDHLICFAVKANSNLAILKLFSEAGVGMDVVSEGERYRAQLAGVSADRIIFSGVGKTEEEMASALKMEERGIFAFNVESIAELETLNRVAASLHRKARVGLRFNPDVNPKTHPYISTGLKKNKFGLPKADLLQIIHRLSKYPAIDVKGISIHIGSQLLSLSPLNDAFKRLRELVDEIGPHLPQPLEFVDLGGGIGIQYKNEKPPTIEAYCAMIQRHFGPPVKSKGNGTPPLKVLIEPGRVLAGNSGIILTKILFRKMGKSKDFLIVDAGMNDLIRPALYSSYHEVVPVVKRSGRASRKADLVGPICETADCFAGNRSLPQSLREGDLLAILSAGAYGFSMAGNYNSRPRPAEVLIQNGSYRIIRKRETLQDLVRGESF